MNAFMTLPLISAPPLHCVLNGKFHRRMPKSGTNTPVNAWIKAGLWALGGRNILKNNVLRPSFAIYS